MKLSVFFTSSDQNQSFLQGDLILKFGRTPPPPPPHKTSHPWNTSQARYLPELPGGRSKPPPGTFIQYIQELTHREKTGSCILCSPYRRGWTGGYHIPSSLPHSPHFPPPSPPLPSPFSPTSLPLLDFSLPLIKCCSYSRTKAYVYVSEELRPVHHRLSCHFFTQNYQVGKELDYLQINVFSRTSKRNIIYTRQNKKTLVYGHFWHKFQF